MSNAILDTTIIADILLKGNQQSSAAKRSLERYETIYLPTFAIKEFKRGPLRAYMWLHNKVVTTQSWAQAIGSVSSVFRQRNLQSTALQAIVDFTSGLRVDRRDLEGLGPIIGADALLSQHARIWLKTKIHQAWRGLFRKPFKLCAPLPCYAITAPRDLPNGLIDYKPLICTLGPCSIQKQIIRERDIAEILENVCRSLPKEEMSKRAIILRLIRRHPEQKLTDNQCIALGDVVFAIQCPIDAIVLTTNIADHHPLTSAIGKHAELP